MKDKVESLFQMSLDCMEDAQILFEKRRFEAITNRAYYGYFDAIRALFTTKEIWGKSHSGTPAKFEEVFVIIDIFPIYTSKNLRFLYGGRL
jgi:hypothetical protein